MTSGKVRLEDTKLNGYDFDLDNKIHEYYDTSIYGNHRDDSYDYDYEYRYKLTKKYYKKDSEGSTTPRTERF